MKRKLTLAIPFMLLLAACSNLPPDETAGIKAYPNPYNPTQGNLTIEKIDGTAFSTTQNDLVVYDFSLHEVYRANPIPVDVGTNKKIVWAGFDNSGIKVAPGVYYLKIVSIGQTSAVNADSMFKLVVQ
jgi:hypothetical protein